MYIAAHVRGLWLNGMKLYIVVAQQIYANKLFRYGGAMRGTVPVRRPRRTCASAPRSVTCWLKAGRHKHPRNRKYITYCTVVRVIPLSLRLSVTYFWCTVAKRLDGSRCHLVYGGIGLGPGDIVLDGDPTPPFRGGPQIWWRE